MIEEKIGFSGMHRNRGEVFLDNCTSTINGNQCYENLKDVIHIAPPSSDIKISYSNVSNTGSLLAGEITGITVKKT